MRRLPSPRPSPKGRGGISARPSPKGRGGISARPFFEGRGGFSLLEVILAMAILMGSIAVLGEAIRLGMRNAEIVRDLTQAQLLCESKLAEIAAGVTPATAVSNARFECIVGDGQTDWVYSISLDVTEEEGLQLLCVTVAQDLPPEKQPASCSLFRWIPDPAMTALAESEAESASTEEATDE